MIESYQERIAMPSMQPHHVEQIIRMARAKQVKLMRLAEDNIELQDEELRLWPAPLNQTMIDAALKERDKK